MGGTVKKQNANLPGNPASVAPLQTPPPEEPRSQGSGWLNPEIARQSRPREIWPLASDRRAFFPGAMGGLWVTRWTRVPFCGWPWNHPGNPTRAAERVDSCLRSGRSGTRGAERELRRLGTWRRPSLAVQPPRRPKSTNPFTRAQEEDWRRRNKTVLTYVAAAAVGMLGASYAAVPLYRLYCQVGLALPVGRPVWRGGGAGSSLDSDAPRCRVGGMSEIIYQRKSLSKETGLRK